MINAESLRLRLVKPTIDEAREKLHDYFNNVMVIDPGAGDIVGLDGTLNGNLKLTKNGFNALVGFIGWNPKTFLDQFHLDPEHSTNLLNQKLRPHLEDSHLRLITQGDKVEGVVSKGYGEIPTPDVFDHYLKQNTGASMDDVRVDGLNTRIVAMPANPQVITAKSDSQVGDIMKIGHLISNGMSGQLSCAYGLILMRLVCLNGMVVADKGMVSRVKHVGENALTRALTAIQNKSANLDQISSWIRTSQIEGVQGRRMEYLSGMVKEKLGKAFMEGVVSEYDVPECPSRRGQPGNTHFDFWNSLTFFAKDEKFSSKRGEAEKMAFKVLQSAPKLPVEDMLNRVRTQREQAIEVPFSRVY